MDLGVASQGMTLTPGHDSQAHLLPVPVTCKGQKAGPAVEAWDHVSYQRTVGASVPNFYISSESDLTTPIRYSSPCRRILERIPTQ